MLSAILILLAIALHVAQPSCAPLVAPESLDKYTVGITCNY